MKKLKKMLFFMFMFLSVFLVFSNTSGSAAEQKGKLVDVIDNIEISKANNKDEGLRKYDKLQIKIDWSAKEELNEGDYFYVDLPSQLYNVNSTFPIKVVDEGKELEAGTCIVESGKLKCISNDFVTTENNIKGNIYIERLFVGNVSEGNTEVPFEFSINGKTTHVEKIEAADSDNTTSGNILNKYGYYDEHNTLVWNLKVNLNNKKVDNLVVEDYIGSNQIIDESSIRIFTCKWDENGELIYESLGENLIHNFKTEIKDNYFKIYLGDTDKNYFITYNVKIVGEQKEYTNKASVEGEKLEKQEVEVNIEALKDYANAIGDNGKKDDNNIIEDVVKDNENKKDDSNIVEKDNKENININKEEEVNKENINKNNISNTGDKLNYAYIIIFIVSIAGIVISMKKKEGLKNE